MISSTLSPTRPRVAYMEINHSVINPPMTWEREFYKSNPQSPQAATAGSFYQPQGEMTKSVNLSPIHKNSSESLKYLLELKQKRKLIEANARLLEGRVMNLSYSEQKAKTHTMELKHKTQEVAEHKLEREAKKRAHEAAKAWYVIGQKSLEDLRATISESRAAHMSEIQRMRETIIQEKKQGAKIIKEQRVTNLETVYTQKQQAIDEKERQYEKVKESEEKVPSKVKAALKKRLQPVVNKKEGQIQDEKNRTQTRFGEIKAFSKQEDVMLDKLKQAEVFNAMAKTEFTEIADMPIDELVGKYNFFLKRRVMNKSMSSQPDKLSFKSF